MKVKTLGEFDDAFIAPVYGFKDKNDYYRKTGSKWWLPFIRVPTIVINAHDDPFFDRNATATEADIGLAPIRLIYHEHGGHCGFVSGDENTERHGWLAEEMSRALLHIHLETFRKKEKFSRELEIVSL
jgi:predicted alpha/beta-fold hydrolase